MNRLIFSFLLSGLFWIVSLTPGLAISNEPTNGNHIRSNTRYPEEQSQKRLNDVSTTGTQNSDEVQNSPDGPIVENVPLKNKLSQIKVEPSSGSSLGACENDDYYIKISGAIFGDGMDISSVTVCGVEVCQILVQSSDLVVVYPNSGNPGTGDIVITSESLGKTTIENAFTYKAPTPNVQEQKNQISNVDTQTVNINISPVK